MLLVKVSVDLRAGSLGKRLAAVDPRALEETSSTHPYSRALSSIQRLKVYAGLVDNPTCQPIEGIELADDHTFSYSAKAGVARTRAQVVNLRCDEGGLCAGARRCGASLGASMAASDNYHIERSKAGGN